MTAKRGSGGKEFLQWCYRNSGSLSCTCLGMALSFVGPLVLWNVKHNQIGHDCSNILYYNANRGRCAAYRLHNGIATGLLETPIIIFGTLFVVLGFLWLVRTFDSEETA